MVEKTPQALAERLKKIDKLSESINAKVGKKVMGRLGGDPEIMDKLRIEFIPTPSQNVNAALGGGFPKKRTTVIAGLPDSGKTSIVLESIGKAMQEDPYFCAGWLESENSLEKDYICKTFGIDPERFLFVEHERTGAGEAALDEVESILAGELVDIMCINSLKCLVPKEEFNKSLKDSVVGTQARMNARMMRKYTSLVAESNTAFVIITHLTTDIGSMSRDPLVISGGNAIIFGASLIMDLRKKSIQEGDPISREEGIKIGLTVKKNHCVPTKNPYLKCDYYAVFGQGIEQYLEALDNAVQQGILVKAGAFIKDLDISGEPKVWNDTKLVWQGKEAFRTFLKHNPDYFKQLLQRINGEVVQMSEEEIAQAVADEEEIKQSVGEEVASATTSTTRSRKKK
jgi:recombination protein RecA